MKLLMSACLLGVNCRYNGERKALPDDVLQRLLERHTVVPVCPEQLGGLTTPREPSERQGERVVMRYDTSEQSFSVDRMRSGQADFSDAFPAVTTAPTHGKVSRVLIFIDKSSVEVFDADGKFAITNLVFPTKPYDRLSVKGGKSRVWKIR